MRAIIRKLMLVVAVLAAASLVRSAAGGAAEDGGSPPPSAPKEAKTIYVIPVEGELNGNVVSSIKRRTAEALKHRPDYIIYDTDTPGGPVFAAVDLVDYMVRTEDNYPNVRFVAYVGNMAASAGTFFIVSCDAIYMSKRGQIGDCQPIFLTPGGEHPYMPAGEKQESFLRSKFGQVAKEKGYPPAIIEGMVSENLDVYRVKVERDGKVVTEYVTGKDLEDKTAYPPDRIKQQTTLVKKGKLIALDGEKAKEYGLAKALFPRLDDLIVYLGGEPDEAVYLTSSAKERVVEILMLLRPLLIIIGAGALFLEFKTPGVGVPLGVAVLCLGLFFFASVASGYADSVDLFLFLLGVTLLAIELFVIPGFGFTGVAGAALMVVGLALSFTGVTWPQTHFETAMFEKGLILAGCSIVGAFVLLVIMAAILPKVPFASRLVLSNEGLAALAAGGAGITAEEGRRSLVGQKGVVVKRLHPAGRIQVGDLKYDVVCEGEYVAVGREVVITDVTGNRIIVRAVDRPKSEY